MSDKTECPGCGSYSSSILRAFDDEDPCPVCGLSADAAAEVFAARRRGADAALTKRYADAVLRADKAEARARQLEDVLHEVRTALDKIKDQRS